MAALEPLTPLWWAVRLQTALRARRKQLLRYADYYDGKHDLPEVAEQHRAEVQRFLDKCRANYCGLVVDAPVQRMEVLGFRVGDGEQDGDSIEARNRRTTPHGQGDQTAWQIWQASDMDAWGILAFREAVKLGYSYLLAGPGDDGPLITVESPFQCIVEYAPGSTRIRDAGLKQWHDSRLNRLNTTLFLRGKVYKWSGPAGSSYTRWEPRIPRDAEGDETEVGEVDQASKAWVVENDLDDDVPLVELRNTPDLYGRGRSDLEGVIEIQDRLNLTLVDRMLTQAWGFGQRFVTGWPLDEELEFKEDPATGERVPAPIPLEVGRSRLLRFPNGANAGTFETAALDPYLAAKKEDVRDIAAIRSLPPQYLLGDLENIAAEGMQVSEASLIFRISIMLKFFENDIEDVMRMALRIADDSRAADSTIHTVWRDPQYRSIAQLTDAVVKQFQAGLITLEVAQQLLGFTPQQIAAMAAQRAAASESDPTLRLLTALNPAVVDSGGAPAAA